jgi:hypothetical protein
MKKEHLTPDGWKPCNAKKRDCQYKEVRVAGAASSVPSPAFIEDAVEDVKARKPNAIKNFFNNLFGSGKKDDAPAEALASVKEFVPAASAPEPVKPLPSSTPPKSVTAGEVVQKENGRYEVLCRATGDTDLYLHKFGDLITDKVTVEKIHQADPNKDYQLGDCGVFARELWNRNEHVKEFCIYYTPHGPKNGVHQFVKLNDGTYADSLGIWTEKAFVDYWEDFDPDGKIMQYEPEEGSSQNPDYSIRNLELFNTVNGIINRHMKGETL